MTKSVRGKLTTLNLHNFKTRNIFVFGNYLDVFEGVESEYAIIPK